ncbi:MAG: family 16 glycosylhydrolase, partial [Clostridia bacterium]|nr:family 16 glycosylhydrolase [Clostridia bacterium]
HSNWTYDLGNTGNPKSSFNTSCTYDRYHTYGLAWDETSLIWYLDGKEVGRYTKSSNKSHLDQGQWPFDIVYEFISNILFAFRARFIERNVSCSIVLPPHNLFYAVK